MEEDEGIPMRGVSISFNLLLPPSLNASWPTTLGELLEEEGPSMLGLMKEPLGEPSTMFRRTLR